MNAYTPYIEFFPTYVDAIKHELALRGEKIKSGHAHEIASAFFGFNTYAALKASGLNKAVKPPQIKTDGYFPVVQNRWKKLEEKLSFPVDDEIIALTYNRLALFYIYESKIEGGAFLRALRQIKENFDYKRNIVMHSIYLDREDLTVFLDIALKMNYSSHRVYPLNKSEAGCIRDAIDIFDSPITEDLLKSEMKPPIIMGDPLANIIEFKNPGVFQEFIFNLK